ncbi:Hypothetical predicted protein [Cloeon dipterum]|uniref:Uncharacterized protein n=1 Tax=Cloeon dipterum TaxID=197152 RepID=A0A8S1DSR2_9INSE|nr:Hypothetical predicted protein [Cloeon dipterum]
MEGAGPQSSSLLCRELVSADFGLPPPRPTVPLGRPTSRIPVVSGRQQRPAVKNSRRNDVNSAKLSEQ